MKIFLNVLGILLILSGGVWILQGINVLLGSFMSGRMEWALLGAASAVVGTAVIVFANRSSKPTDR